MKVWKLTDENDQSFGYTQWGQGKTHQAPGSGPLCSDGWLHCYADPLLAAALNPIHANFFKPHLWEAEAQGAVLDDHSLKLGVQCLTTIRRRRLPRITDTQRVRAGIKCALKIVHNRSWREWAGKWLRGEDRQAVSRYMNRAWDEDYPAKHAAEAAYYLTRPPHSRVDAGVSIAAYCAANTIVACSRRTDPIDFVGIIKQAIIDEKE